MATQIGQNRAAQMLQQYRFLEREPIGTERFGLCARRRNRVWLEGIRFRKTAQLHFGSKNLTQKLLICDLFRPMFPRLTINFGVGGLEASE